MPKLGLLIALLSLAVGVRAQTTFQLSGTISSVSGTSAFAVGQPFTITVAYRTDLTDANSNTQIGLYDPAITSYEFNYANGAYVGTASDGRFFIYDNFELGKDETQMDIAGTTNFASVDGYTFNPDASGPYFFLTNNSGSVFSSDILPTIFPTTGWDSGNFTLGWGQDEFDMFSPAISVNGTITSVSAVPEPATTAVLAGALALLAVLCWRHRPRQA
ncbi:MAG TPA: PEP-CTERM sorting domain-containing protein [Opitutus sp.]|nr:PEP-CTERM sorting domain-containing protein [Opitutus sp.]